MNAVIGTAGHVDHGKSSLIHALTGIHPSRLPEERERAMTIDLGFANFTATDGSKIGIIDVPGHERFIRNMVSAVWGLDLVLFVVAADEGWAALSEEHLRIITAMGKHQCILVLTKCDLVDDQRRQAVEDDALERFLDTMNTLPDVVHVSSIQGTGLTELKALIESKVNDLPARDELDHGAHLYVDRVFSVNGIGTTVTGTLRGAPLEENATLTLFPGNMPVKVRSLQSYHTQVETAAPYSRTAVGLKQVNKKLVKRGSCLVADSSSITMSDDWIIQLDPQFSSTLKKQGMVEVALGTTHTHAKCFTYADGQLARLQLKEAIPAFWGQPMLIIQHGGSHIIGAGKIAWMHPLDRSMRDVLQQALTTLTIQSADLESKLALEIQINGFTERHAEVQQPATSVVLGQWWILPAALEKLHQACSDVLNQAISAMTVEDIAKQVKHPLSLTEAMIEQGCQKGEWQRIKGGIVNAFNLASDTLPDNLQQLYDAIDACGSAGFEAGKSRIVGIKRLLRALTEKSLIVPTENDIFFSTKAYEQLVQNIMLDRKLGERFTVADARERTDLSRKQLIPLFNRMEKDGWVKRIENDREVCREYPSSES
ncbi:selenocysteine-specific translation elongation factor [Wohlfahrtiimonas chitiniclastica]|uniref:selenocysteine-specific translation elongation factor n=1 Tax=Wohlfahrtiimonas chitiniclastica TaxID=400946 RepID=UPI000B9915E4|nr:selenocysteine-specific translation elongation factor [Wohlfahrtiimonas chitiniclastica]OYQ74903.1 selenocysteine-specific translation elongation factor [Wohlfahrtiimonas chitiniclastica]